MNENAADWFVDRNIREGRADKAAFIEAWDGGRTLSYGGLADGAARCASAFQSAAIELEERVQSWVETGRRVATAGQRSIADNLFLRTAGNSQRAHRF